MEKWHKDAFKRIIAQARTYLPGERLRAVARVNPGPGGTHLEGIFPEDSDDFIRFYHENKDDLAGRVGSALDKMEIEFIDPELNKDILTQDIIKTYVEHNLSNLARYGNTTKKGLEGNIRILEEASFDDPVWERYRRMLVSRFQRRLQALSEPSPGNPA